MNHSFESEIAKEVGIVPAIILDNIVRSTSTEHFYDGQFWTEATSDYFELSFPYISKSKINSGLEKLIDEGFIKTRISNNTNFYALTEKSSVFYPHLV